MIEEDVLENIFRLYLSGLSIPSVSEKIGRPKSSIRLALKDKGILRSRTEAIRLVPKDIIGSGRRGKKFVFSDQHKKRISIAKLGKGKGISLKPSGYFEHTMGPNKSRSAHVVIMESRIGRRILRDECVHHIDGDKLNNNINNLALMTRSGHSRLHRREDKLSGKVRSRDKKGRII